MNIRIVENGPVRLATETFGDPAHPALLLIMGANASMLEWPEAFCEALATHGRFVIRFDHRDTGQSSQFPAGDPGYTVDDMATDIIAILDAYGCADADLVGMSLGGYIAQMVAERRPDRVRTLTLIASEPLGWDGADLPPISEAFLAHFGGLATLDIADRAAVGAFLLEIARLCAGSAYPFARDDISARIARDLGRRDGFETLFNHATLEVVSDWAGAYARITLPTLVIHGTEDPILPFAKGMALAGAIPGARLEPLEGVGHELPGPLLEPIAALIADHVGARSRPRP